MIGILLAAGFSRRFGDADKLLHVMEDGRSIAVASAQNLMSAVPLTIAVVRRENVELQQALKALGVTVTLAEGEEEMADSLALAIRFASSFDEAETGFVIALADMPFIQPITIQAIGMALLRGASIVVPTYTAPDTGDIRRGHPVAFSACFTQPLQMQQGDMGAKRILQRHQDDITFLPCEDPGILVDIDTLADIP